MAENPFLKRGKKPLPEEKKHTSTREERGDANKDKDIEYVSLSGYGLTKGGEIVKRNYFTFLKDYVGQENDLILPKEEAIKLQKYMLGLSTGTAAIAPLVCAGPRCPYNYCIFLDETNDLEPPLGRPCPIEMEIIKKKKIDYINEYEIDMASPTELSMIDELVRLEILEMRITAALGKERDSTTVSEETIAVMEEQEIQQRRVSPYMESLYNIHNMKAQIIKKMVGDRESRWKKAAALKQREDKTRADDWADLADQVDELNRQIKLKASDHAKPIVVDVDNNNKREE